MKAPVSSRMRDYMKKFGILLVMVALITGIVSCDGGASCGGGVVEWDLTTSSSGGGKVVVGEGKYADGTVVVIEAVADECYEFVMWTGADVADPYSPITTITMDQAKNIVANFALLSYDLTTDSTDGGAVTAPGEGIVTYDCGTVVDLMAEADEGYRFVEWIGDVGTIADINAAETIITMNGAYSITANFIARFNLTMNSTDGGEVVTPGEGTFTYDSGTVVELLAEAEESYHFVQWTGNTGTIADTNAAETTVIMDGAYNITANFILFAGGSGTTEDPYRIADWRHLDNVRNYLGAHFIVINDLDCTSVGYTELASTTANGGKGWQPLGTTVGGAKFYGGFDGQGYEICDLFIARPAESDVGLFGVVGQGAVVENVGVVNGNVTGNDDVGGLAGKNEGSVSDSYSTGSVSGNNYVGGLVGKNEGTVSDSYSTSSVSGNARVGGLAGQNSATVDNSYASGSVSGSNYVGGLVGRSEGPVGNSYASGSVNGSGYVGGLVGRNEDTVSNSYSVGGVIGSSYVGGLVGQNTGTVGNSFWDTQTSGRDTSAGGMGKTTAQMKDIDTFTGVGWDIIAVADSNERKTDYIWNIVDDVAYPFLSWQPV